MWLKHPDQTGSGSETLVDTTYYVFRSRQGKLISRYLNLIKTKRFILSQVTQGEVLCYFMWYLIPWGQKYLYGQVNIKLKYLVRGSNSPFTDVDFKILCLRGLRDIVFTVPEIWKTPCTLLTLCWRDTVFTVPEIWKIPCTLLTLCWRDIVFSVFGIGMLLSISVKNICTKMRGFTYMCTVRYIYIYHIYHVY